MSVNAAAHHFTLPAATAVITVCQRGRAERPSCSEAVLTDR